MPPQGSAAPLTPKLAVNPLCFHAPTAPLAKDANAGFSEGHHPPDSLTLPPRVVAKVLESFVQDPNSPIVYMPYVLKCMQYDPTQETVGCPMF